MFHVERQVRLEQIIDEKPQTKGPITCASMVQSKEEVESESK